MCDNKISRIVGLAVVLCSFVISSGVVWAEGHHHNREGCTLATLQGNYLVTGRQDNRSDAPDPMLPSVVAGIRTFDGEGNLSQVVSDSRGGTITRRIAATGTYTLDSNCMGTMTINGRNWDIYVAEDGSEGVGTRTDDGTIFVQTFKRPVVGEAERR